MKISGFKDIIFIEKFEYINCVDCHALCFFSACVKVENRASIMSMVNQDIIFEDGEFKFTGRITDISFTRDIRGDFIEVKTVGKTYSYDIDRYSRIFQQRDKTLSDILYKMKSMSNVDYQCNEDPVIENVVFQKNETEWTFIKRLVNGYGLHLFFQDKTIIGKYGKKITELDEKNFFYFKIISTLNVSRIVCRTKKFFEIASIVNFSGIQYYIKLQKYKFDNEIYYFEYLLEETKAQPELQEYLDNDILYAKVINNDDPDKKGRLQVSFETESIEDCMKNSPCWLERIDVFASRGLGPVCIPHKDDLVRVHLYHGDCKIVGCVRTDAYNNSYNNCEYKYWLLDDDIYVRYGDGKMMFHNKDNQIEISVDEVLIASGDKVKISTTSDNILMQKDKSAIELTSDINALGAKFIVESKGEASITAKKVNIKGNSGVSIN